MPCLVALIALCAPRFAILLVVFFSDYIGTAYETTIWPLVGFFITPLGTLAYAWAWHRPPAGDAEGIALAVVMIAMLMDLGIIGGGSASAKRKKGKSPRLD